VKPFKFDNGGKVGPAGRRSRQNHSLAFFFANSVTPLAEAAAGPNSRYSRQGFSSFRVNSAFLESELFFSEVRPRTIELEVNQSKEKVEREKELWRT
jgi:hypothetical protein